MTPRRAALWFGGGTLLAAWLAAAAGPSLAPEAGPPVPDEVMSESDRKALELAAAAEQLSGRLSVAVSQRPMRRNPFSFVSPAARTAPAARGNARAAIAVPGEAAVTTSPRVTLLGVAEDRAGTEPARTAIVSLAGVLLLVKEGEVISGGRFRVTRIAADALELDDTVESRTIRLALP